MHVDEDICMLMLCANIDLAEKYNAKSRAFSKMSLTCIMLAKVSSYPTSIAPGRDKNQNS